MNIRSNHHFTGMIQLAGMTSSRCEWLDSISGREFSLITLTSRVRISLPFFPGAVLIHMIIVKYQLRKNKPCD